MPCGVLPGTRPHVHDGRLPTSGVNALRLCPGRPVVRPFDKLRVVVSGAEPRQAHHVPSEVEGERCRGGGERKTDNVERRPILRFPFSVIRGSTELITPRARRTAGKVEGRSRRDVVRPVGLTARFVLLLIAGYKVLLSPLFAGSCRFTPSCSDYMAGAVRQHGVWRGGLLGLRRLWRCRPLGPHGFDPVPDTTGRAVRFRQQSVKVR